MSRRSLRPQLNQIRGWVRQGRTDAWIAHQLEVTVQQIQAFKREHGLEPDGEGSGEGVGADEVDLRAEDDAAIAVQLEEEEQRRAEEEAKAAEEAARKAAEAEAAEAA
jgi:peptidoglycan hydrolase-like protein with peptidoglycan-binding domain